MNIRGVAWHVISWVFSFVSSQDCRRGRGYLHLRLTHYSSRLSMCVAKGDRKGKGGRYIGHGDGGENHRWSQAVAVRGIIVVRFWHSLFSWDNECISEAGSRPRNPTNVVLWIMDPRHICLSIVICGTVETCTTAHGGPQPLFITSRGTTICFEKECFSTSAPWIEQHDDFSSNLDEHSTPTRLVNLVPVPVPVPGLLIPVPGC